MEILTICVILFSFFSFFTAFYIALIAFNFTQNNKINTWLLYLLAYQPFLCLASLLFFYKLK